MLQTFDCPKCGAPVSYEKDVVGANLTARCSYCNSSLSVPDEMRGRPAQIISHVTSDMRNVGSGAKATRWILLIVMIPLFGVVIGTIAMGGFLAPLLSGFNSSVKRATPTTTAPKASGGKEKRNAFATQTLNFGSEGIGPGMFKDARAIAVDASGKIYVGEYSGGRIQVFDPDGKFITQWMVYPKMPLTGMAAGRNGVVYIVQSGMISRHEGATGQLLGQLEYAGGWGFDDIKVAADGGLIARRYKTCDGAVRSNPARVPTATSPAPVSCG